METEQHMEEGWEDESYRLINVTVRSFNGVKGSV